MSLKNEKKKPVVFIVCTGLGRINRGYESFTQECYEALKNINEFDLYLIKGGGQKSAKEIVIPNFNRNGYPAKFLSKLLNKKSYIIEQFSFCISLLPLIIKRKPSVVYYSDFIAGTYLWHLRKLLKFKYRLLFVNGAPNGPPYKTEDHIQQLLPVYLNDALEKGETAAKQTLLPYAFNINITNRLNAINRKHKIRTELGFSQSQKIILSVGAVNKRHKRIDYIINEVALLSRDYFLIVLGQYDDETAELITLAKNKLPGRCLIKNISHNEIGNYYLVADCFVLASLSEGFPRVTIEALSFGLPCIVHDYIITHQVLRDHGIFIDMRFEGELSNFLNKKDNKYLDKSELINAAYNLYSWDKLKDKYADMILKQINNN